MKAIKILSVSLISASLLILSACGKPAHDDVQEASMALSSNPFYSEDAQIAAAVPDGDGGTIPGGPGGGGGGDGGSVPNPSASPNPTSTPQPSSSPAPTNTPAPTSSPAPTNTPEPSSSPAPTNTPAPTNSPVPSNVPNPTETPNPIPQPSVSPNPSETPNPIPQPSVSPSPSESPNPIPQPSSSPNPVPSPSSSPQPSASPSPSCTPNSKTEAGFVRVCSQMRSGIKDFIFFEEAKNPLLTVEHIYEEKDPKTKKNVTKFMVLSASSMYGMNLLKNPKPTLPISVDLASLKAKYPSSWSTKTLKAFICEDKNQTGSCSNKVGFNVLSIGDVSFRADRIPQRLSFELWSGRNKLKKTDPKLCEKQYSPLVLDMKGDGIKLSGPGKGVRFDLDDTGMAVLTGWVDAADDVFLVRDLNANGSIDTGAELFGSATKLKSGLRALNGFEALIDLDSDQDGQFTANDEAWSEIQVWADKNLDAYTDADELMSLDRVGIISIDLNYVTKDDVDQYGNATKQRSTFVRRVKGKLKTHVVIDVWFNTLIPH